MNDDDNEDERDMLKHHGLAMLECMLAERNLALEQGREPRSTNIINRFLQTPNANELSYRQICILFDVCLGDTAEAIGWKAATPRRSYND
jgi:hypothetical protein